MIILSYTGTGYEDLLQQLAVSLNASIVQDKLTIPSSIGSGFLELVNLPMGIQALLSDYTIADEFYFIRQKSDADTYNLRLEMLGDSKRTLMMVDEAVVHDLPKAYIYLNSLHYSLSYKAAKGVTSKSLNLRFSREVLKNITGYTDENDLLVNSVSNTINPGNIIYCDIQTLGLMDEIFQLPVNDPDRKFKIFNRSLSITEYFFDKIKTVRDGGKNKKLPINREDYKKMEEIEKMITSDVGLLPPTQDQLASIAKISVSKLKYTFKKVYGTGIYDYFQRARMQKALQLLQDGNSVRTTAGILGYKDIGNFNRNFKKEFNISPGKISTKNFNERQF